MTTHSSTYNVSSHNAHSAAFLVMVNGKPAVVHADTKPVHKAGIVFFWFFHNGRKVQAVRTASAPYFTA